MDGLFQLECLSRWGSKGGDPNPLSILVDAHLTLNHHISHPVASILTSHFYASPPSHNPIRDRISIARGGGGNNSS